VGLSCATPKGTRSQPCAGQNMLPLSTDAVQVTSNTKDIYSPVNSAVLPTCSHTGSCKCLSLFLAAALRHTHAPWLAPIVIYVRRVRRHVEILRKSESSEHMVNCVSSLNPNCNTLEPDRPQHNRPAPLSPSSILLPPSSHRAFILATKNWARVLKRYLKLF
jgi:hypothetical protein